MSTAATPTWASPDDPLELLTSVLSQLAAADTTQMPASEQAACVRALERADAIVTAVRTRVLGAFTTGQGCVEDGDYSPRSWLIHKTRVTKGAAMGHAAWVRRARSHPVVLAALTAGEMTESWARTLCGWTGPVPDECRDAADEILAAAARAGMDLRDLAALAAELRARLCPADGDDPDGSFQDRGVRLETTFQGAGVLSGDLSPECAALVGTVLDALSVPCGAEDPRDQAERYHDALEEAMRRLVAAVSVAGGDGGAWLDGDAAEGAACDGSITPVVFGEVNFAVLDDLVSLCAQLAIYRHGSTATTATATATTATATACSGSAASGLAGLLGLAGSGDPAGSRDSVPAAGDPGAPPGLLSREALERAIIGKAVALVSGPGGLAGFLRREQLGARLAGPSLPLDVGYSDNVPSAIRTAVKVRDRFCQWAGGCHQAAAACEVHHLRHKGHGGETNLENCILLCHFHHHVMIHRMGWTLVRHPDGTTTAWNRGKTKVLRSHSPPNRTG